MLSNIVEIPIRGSDEIIEVDSSNLPHYTEIINIMQQERIPLYSAYELGLAYYRVKDYDGFESIMSSTENLCDSQYEGSDRDLMHILDCLAIFYTRKGQKCSDESSKRLFFEKATTIYTKTDRMATYDQLHLLARAFFYLQHGGAVQQAEEQFDFILSKDPYCIPALLGKANIVFNRKEYKRALKCYSEALRANPKSPPSIRLGIGLCYLKLGNMDKARMAFGRTLKLDSSCVGALVGMALFELNTKVGVSVKNGTELLSAAYGIDPNNPMVLNHLANHFFYRKDYAKVKPLAQHAFNKAVHEGMKMESLYHIARYHHAMGNYESAFIYYFQCTQHASQTFLLPYYGLGQIYLWKNDRENAIGAFKRVLEILPNNYETLKVLGCMHATSNNTGDRNKAKEYLGKVTSMQSYDVEAWIEFSQILEHSDPQKSYDAYKKASHILENNDVPPEILNNIGALSFKLNKLREAEKYLESALEGCMRDVAKNETYYTMISVTVKYNIGRVYEALHDSERAQQIYLHILETQPKYIDCHFRLFSIMQSIGRHELADDHLKRVLSIDKNNCDAWVMLSNMHMDRHELGPAQNKLELVLKMPRHQDDSYSVVAMGNIWLEMIHIPIKDENKTKKQQDRALSFYTHILNLDPNNLYAANGIGCVMAKKGLINEARDVFAQVRDATADFEDVWLNIGHIFMEKKQYRNAIQMYENCIKKFSTQLQLESLMYLARGLFKNGEYEKCNKVLESALMIFPTNYVVMFNLATTLQKHAMCILEDDKSNLRAVLYAVMNLQMSLKYFHHVARAGDPNRSEVRRASQGLQLCRDLLSQTDPHIERAKKIEMMEQALRISQEEERKAIKQRQIEEANERERQQLLRDQSLRDQRAAMIEKTRQLSESRKGVNNDDEINF